MFTYMGTYTQSQLKIWVPTNSLRSRFDYLVTISDDDLGAYAHSAQISDEDLGTFVQSQIIFWIPLHNLR